MSLPFGVIIAGGAGQRLGGVRKAELRVGGVRLLERVAAAFGPVAAPLLIATGPHRAPAPLPDGALAVPDLPAAVGGPLAGLAAAVAALKQSGIESGVLVSAPVDTPFLPAGFAQVMADALGQAEAIYARHDQDFYPPVAAWRLEALQSLAGDVGRSSAPASLKALHRQLGSAELDWPAEESNPFININTLAEVLAAEKRERQHNPPQIS
ncbi:MULTISPECIES: NTP transferase domain-containing protein [unclassified Devosia]|uniref:molybdenum cofactor guanylyltransferase n=1 Tax=unclassified Devosia TaxID=196773 RepID=UPI0015565C9D|nr:MULTISPECIES: NTP transferase domain-containing protein [unclassified Devosia]